MLHLATWLSLLSAVLAAPSPLQQLPFHSPAAVHPLGDRVRLPASESAHLVARLAELPKYDLARLEQHVHAWTGPRTVRLRAGNGQAGQVVKVTEGEKALLTLAGIRYVDITAESDGDDDQHPLLDANRYPSRLSHNLTTLSPLFETISLTTMKEFLVKFTGFHSRYYRSQSGRDSQLFLLDHLKTLHRNLNPRANVSFREFDHEWIQKSIIVRWEPRVKSKDYKDEVVILSAHQDSTNSLPFLPAPGADDDASGTVTLISTLTQLLSSRFEPVSNPIEFHFYSAEEGGLLGSGEIAKEYRAAGKSVRGMFHMDVVAYVKPGTKPVIGMITDGTNSDLVGFMKLVVDEFATIPYAETQCGYGCSDFASFTKYGFPSTCLAEGLFEDSNPNMHSMKDSINAEGYSLEHTREFVRVAIGYAVELGGMERVSRRRGDDKHDGRWRME